MEEQTIIDYTQYLTDIQMILLYLLAINTIMFASILVLIFFVVKGDYGK